MWRHSPLKTVFILGPMAISFALGLDIYMPAIPEMQVSLHTTPSMVQLTLSLYLIFVGIGQLVIGPLSDQIGRKKTLFFSSVLFVISCFLCAQTSSIYNLILYRIIQGVAGCGLSVTTYAIIRDSFNAKNSGVIYSSLNTIIAISPIMGPIIGVALTSYFTWHSVFYLLFFLGVISLLLTIFFVDETLEKSKVKKFNFDIFKRYKSICSNLQFWAFTLPALAGISSFFVLFSMTPYVITILDKPRSTIGIYFGLAGISYMFGSILSSLLIKRFGILKITMYGCVSIIIAGFLQAIIQKYSGLSLFGFFGPAMVATFGCALCCGSGASGALEPFGEYSGAAAAMFGAVELGGSAFVGSIVMTFKVNSAYPMAFAIIIMAVIAITATFIFHRKNRR